MASALQSPIFQAWPKAIYSSELNLLAYRKAKGLSQEALAEVLGVHRTHMGGMERGERNLTFRSVERIAKRLGIEPLGLLDGRA